MKGGRGRGVEKRMEEAEGEERKRRRFIRKGKRSKNVKNKYKF